MRQKTRTITGGIVFVILFIFREWVSNKLLQVLDPFLPAVPGYAVTLALEYGPPLLMAIFTAMVLFDCDAIFINNPPFLKWSRRQSNKEAPSTIDPGTESNPKRIYSQEQKEELANLIQASISAIDHYSGEMSRHRVIISRAHAALNPRATLVWSESLREPIESAISAIKTLRGMLSNPPGIPGSDIHQDALSSITDLSTHNNIYVEIVGSFERLLGYLESIIDLSNTYAANPNRLGQMRAAVVSAFNEFDRELRKVDLSLGAAKQRARKHVNW